MDLVATVAIQQARAAAFLSLAQQAVTLFMITDDDDDDDVKKRCEDNLATTGSDGSRQMVTAGLDGVDPFIAANKKRAYDAIVEISATSLAIAGEMRETNRLANEKNPAFPNKVISSSWLSILEKLTFLRRVSLPLLLPKPHRIY